jgi:predicted enzyme related to lactoylglutathione lyase
MRIDGVYIELVSADPERLAGFYERLAGLERAPLTGHAVFLQGGGLTLAIRRGDEVAPDSQSDGPVVGFLVSSADLDSLRDELAAVGAVVLSESKREARRTFHCCDPSGNEFAILVPIDEAAAPVNREALVVVPREAAGGERTTPENPTLSPPISPPRAQVTRRDIDRLRDLERLAAMQEAIAGLHVGFTPGDPAAVVDEMRDRLAGDPTQARLAEHDALLRAQQRAADAESLLARYKREIGENPRADDVPRMERSTPGSTPRPVPAAVDEDDAVDMARLRRSLGGSAESDE